MKYAGEARGYLVQLHQIRYWDSLLEDVGADIKRKKSGFGPIFDSFLNFFVPVYSSDYKSIATGEWKEQDGENKHGRFTKYSFLVEWACFVGVIVSVANVDTV